MRPQNNHQEAHTGSRRNYTFHLIIMMSSSWVYLIFRTYYHRLVSALTHSEFLPGVRRWRKKHTKIFFLLYRRRLTFSLCLLLTSKKRPVDLWCMNQFFIRIFLSLNFLLHIISNLLVCSPNCISAYRSFLQYFSLIHFASFVVILWSFCSLRFYNKNELALLSRKLQSRGRDVRMKSV